MAERRGLGRGLTALMADVGEGQAPAGDAPRRPEQVIPIERIAPNPDQPRRRFGPEALQELSNSIREKGILQPLILRPAPGREGHYQIVAGERRWRAAQMAQVHEVPAIVRDFDDTEVLEVAIIENIQRADLNAVEEAQGYRALMERFGHTQEKLAEALGKSRSHIANLMRLLTLPDRVLEHVAEGRLTAGHARALVTSEDPERAATEVIGKNLSVRETEKLAGGARKPSAPKRSAGPGAEKDADTRALEQDLSATLGMRVSIDHGADGQGEVRIGYASLEQLDDLCQKLTS